MSSSTWKRYSVSAISMPARNAPSTSDSPARRVTNAASRMMSSTFSTKSSFERSGDRKAEQAGRFAERRQHDQQRHHGEVLEEQYADHLAAVRRVELAAL